MASTLSKLRADVEDDLEAQVARLSKELASLRKSLGKRGASVYADGREGASDLYEDVRERLVEALPMVRRKAHAVERAAKDNPATAAAVGLVVLGLLATMLLRRR